MPVFFVPFLLILVMKFVLQDGKVGKIMFMERLRSVVGDEMLRSTIHEIRG